MENKKNQGLDNIKRCEWLSNDPFYIKYHDVEWGKPELDSVKLFEILCLEGQQAGLSWITILKKRENYRKLYQNFDPYKISKFTNTNITNLLNNTDIVRHKGKIEAIVNNSKCYIKMEEEGTSFSDFIWDFVDHRPIVNNWKSSKEVPSESDISVALSKALKNKGFKYVGSKICYAFLQAAGLVNDHITDCAYR